MADGYEMMDLIWDDDLDQWVPGIPEPDDEDDAQSESSWSDSYWRLHFGGPESDRRNDTETIPVDVAAKIPDEAANYIASFSRINEFLVADKYTDVKIICQDRIFRCHRLILAAASEYFDTMFSAGLCESNATDIPVHGIDVAVFEEILKYMYKGKVEVNDDNVYDLLCASEMLGLQFIENCCVQYVEKRSVPLQDVHKIFIFACRTRNESLTTIVGRFILEHLEKLSCCSEFLEFSLDELTTLLMNCQLMYSREEHHLLDAIFRWVSRSGASHREKKLSFTKLTENIIFQHISAVDVAEYFDKHAINSSESYDNNAFDASRSEYKIVKSLMNLSLNAYVSSYGADWEQPSTELFTLQESNKITGWHSCALKSEIVFLKSVVFDDRLYYFSLLSYSEPITFRSSSSISLSANSVSLALPPNYQRGYTDFHGSLCCNKKGIYLFCDWQWAQDDVNRCESCESSVYNCELDSWFSLPSCVGPEYSTNPCVTCDDHRVYLVGGCDPTQPGIARRCMRAFDHRVGKWEQLRKSKMKHAYPDALCVHKEKIYISSNEEKDPRYFRPKVNVMEVFDLVAGKWDAIEIKLTEKEERKHNYSSRWRDSAEFIKSLLSYNNMLYLFASKDGTDVLTYNSLLGEWSIDSGLTSTPVTRPGRSIISVLDAVTFKSDGHNL